MADSMDPLADLDAPRRRVGRRVSERFRFRFVVRGEQANALVRYAMTSLRRCHPGAGIVLVDANDTPAWVTPGARIEGDVAIVHLPPEEDDVARAVGRGSRRHLFYWRHSPQVLEALPATDRYAVYADADIVFLRPLDLASLLGPLARGRIAAALDESTLEYFQALSMVASTPARPCSRLPARAGRCCRPA
ncbi:MAG: hypothetical protein ACRDYA_12710 [Egibacteraceae bacterium]